MIVIFCYIAGGV